MECLGLINVNLKHWPYHILTSMGMSKRAQELTKHKVIIQINHAKPTSYTTMHAHTMVTHATSYGVLVGRAILYPLGVKFGLWHETTH